MIPPAFFFLKIVLAIQVRLSFHINCRKLLSVYKNFVGILMGIILDLYIDMGKIDIITVLSFPLHEHNVPLRLFKSSLISSAFCNLKIVQIVYVLC